MSTSNPVIHFELPAHDRERMKAFYTSAFDWKMNQLGTEMNDYVVAHTGPTDENGMIQKPGMINGGLYTVTPDMPPQYPSVVIAVDDIDASMAKVKEAGGTVQGEAMDIPGVGKYVSFVDTEGNRLSMMQPVMRA